MKQSGKAGMTVKSALPASVWSAVRGGLAGVFLAGACIAAVLLPTAAQAKMPTHRVPPHREAPHRLETHALHVSLRQEAPLHRPTHARSLVRPARELKRTGRPTHIIHHIVLRRVAKRESWQELHEAAERRHYERLAEQRRLAEYRHFERVEAEFRRSPLQCVPYAREVSHIELTGDAFLWWPEAAGRYARGNVPVVGSVLNFRPIHRMPLGHVAVVTAVLNSRTILVTQANWVPDAITNDVTVEDVSPDNNWTDVRVELGDTSSMGSTYPTYGFIYDHPAGGTVIASNGGGRDEVAEAPVSRPVASQAPDRNLQ